MTINQKQFLARKRKKLHGKVWGPNALREREAPNSFSREFFHNAKCRGVKRTALKGRWMASVHKQKIRILGKENGKPHVRYNFWSINCVAFIKGRYFWQRSKKR